MMPTWPKIDGREKTIEGLKIFNLVEHYESPLLIFSEKVIKEKHASLVKALNSHHPNYQIAYSLKTNYLPGVVKIMKNLGCHAEVVSGFEYWLAKKIGFAPDQIIFNGPDKKVAEIATAIKEGASLNIDNQSELREIIDFAKGVTEQINIGLRVNADIKNTKWSRFGFKLENGEAEKAIGQIKRLSNLNIRGLHIHMNTNISDPSYYEEAASKMADFALRMTDKFGVKIDYINLGGGLAVPGSKWQNSSEWLVPDIDEYVEKIADVFNKKFLIKKPTLIFEPGRYLIDEAGVFLVTALDIKEKLAPPQLNNQGFKLTNFVNQFKSEVRPTQIITVDSSTTSVSKSAFIRNKLLEVIHKEKDKTPDYEIESYVVGNSCMGNDFLAWGISLPQITAGDLLLLYNNGAYTIVKSEQFINPRPAVIMIKENGDVECVRRKESYENMIALDEF